MNKKKCLGRRGETFYNFGCLLGPNGPMSWKGGKKDKNCTVFVLFQVLQIYGEKGKLLQFRHYSRFWKTKKIRGKWREKGEISLFLSSHKGFVLEKIYFQILNKVLSRMFKNWSYLSRILKNNLWILTVNLRMKRPFLLFHFCSWTLSKDWFLYLGRKLAPILGWYIRLSICSIMF